MGRWAQARRTGGGDNPLNFMTFALNTDIDEMQVTYNKPISAEALDPTDFRTNPNDILGNTIVQVFNNTIRVTFDDEITGEPTLTYEGTGSNVVTPQTIAQT